LFKLTIATSNLGTIEGSFTINACFYHDITDQEKKNTILI